MDAYEKFREMLKKGAEEFRKTDAKEVIRVVSHLDADGISSAAVIISALNRELRRYSLSTVHQVDEDILKQLSAENYNIFFFTDLGTGQFSLIKKYLPGKKVFILDHHQLQDEYEDANIVHVNPNLCGVDGSTEVSGSGVTYLFSKALDAKNVDLAHIAILGALGDMQENRGFKSVNNEILEDAKKSGKIKVITGLRVFGAQTRPLHKLLEQSNEYPIPGVTGNESSAIAFLQQIGIDPRKGSAWKKLVELTDDELQTLATSVILKRLDEAKPEAILGPVYILKDEVTESPMKDAREFATVLNACGRLGKASIGIGACMGNPQIKEKALKTLLQYKKEISNALTWYRNAKAGVTKGKGYMIINAEDNIMPTIIGTLASIVSKSNELENGTFILSLAQMNAGKTKVSFRIAGNAPEGINLKEIISKMTAQVDGQAGGHHQAAGAIISTEKEQEFIDTAKRILEMHSIESKLTP